MSLFQIQDDIIRRALDYFGLRGVVSHGYESTVIPTVSIGDLSAPLIAQRSVGNTPATDLWLVPQNESWRPILLMTTLVQAAGTTAARWKVLYLSASGASFFSMSLPSLWSNVAAFSVGEALLFTAALNTGTDVVTRFPDRFLMGPGSRIQITAAPGDGVITADAQSLLVYQRIGERMVELK